MDSAAAIAAEQVAWAQSAGLHPDQAGYLPDWQRNLCQPLSRAANEAFSRGAGAELLPSADGPPKMAALHSSAALAVNVFDYWTDRSLDPISEALRLRETPASFTFESTFSTGLRGTPPTLDLAFFFANGTVLGVESKFTEWLSPKSHRGRNFAPSYFPERDLWTKAGLGRAQDVADALRKGEEQFTYLDAAQLLKHMLGLATQHQGRASLYYLFYDWPSGQESAAHRIEMDRFARLVGTEQPFQWATYQDVFLRLARAVAQGDGEYMQYLRARYFRSAV